MNRLKNMRGYLCGPIEYDQDLGVGWRKTLKEETKDLNIQWFDPCDKPIDIGFEDLGNHETFRKLKKEHRWDEVRNATKIIRGVDLRMVDVSDFLIVNIDTSTHTCGTYEEIFLANRQKKPIIVRVKQGKEYCPSWFFGTIPHQMIFSTWKGVQTYLRHIAYSSLIENYNRWYFFDLE